MKKIYFLLIVLCTTASVNAQNINFGDTGGFFGWFRLGTLTLQQQGADASIQVISGGGYNASYHQNGECHIHFRTSNGASQLDGFFASGSFYNTGRTKILSSIRVIQTNLYTWEFYAMMPSYTGQEAVLSLSSVSGSWQPSLAKLDPPTNLTALDLTEEFLVSSKTYFMDNVGIGTTTPREKLSVNGNIRAKEVKVESTNWPDYVFGENYQLTSLPDLEKYIMTYKHLPEMPSADEVSLNGLEVGKMNNLLLKKMEEMTLMLIEQDKQIRKLKEQIKLK
ncbi:hypothetical protein QF042_001879 [Pedobacter sp. W3I1]|uniref:hypothetical protein n=1 Tax=Pedobacter sp. W3I1 TaxID=3042291 RepID=UPI00278934F2|nr:hypothetical protein [Pedobacter sp. W3I1]MDQ0638314.1 hypothetical protein [Pedobacter sp. W3I1]